jgi:hypothetical protein
VNELVDKMVRVRLDDRPRSVRVGVMVGRQVGVLVLVMGSNLVQLLLKVL